MSNIKNFNNFINENYKNIDKLTLYHGTCLPNAQNIIDNGWKPLSSSYGSNMGNSNYYIYQVIKKMHYGLLRKKDVIL